jgi:hypothetical protein
MKGDSAGIEIEINNVLNESLEGKANPVHSIIPLKGDVCYDGDEDGSPAAISSNKVLWLQPKTKKLAVTASVFVFFLFICIGIGIRSSNKNGPAATVNALALQGSDGIAPTVIGGTPLDQGVWQEFRRYLVSIRWNDSHICGGTLISSRVVLTAARKLKIIHLQDVFWYLFLVSISNRHPPLSSLKIASTPLTGPTTLIPAMKLHLTDMIRD